MSSHGFQSVLQVGHILNSTGLLVRRGDVTFHGYVCVACLVVARSRTCAFPDQLLLLLLETLLGLTHLIIPDWAL